MAEASHEDDVNIEETDQDLPDQKQTSETGATKRVDAVRAQRLGLPLKSTNTDTSTATSTVTTKPAPVDWKTREEQRMKRFGTPSPADKLAAREQRFASDNTAKSTSNGSPSTKPSPLSQEKIQSRMQRFGIPIGTKSDAETEAEKKRKRELRFMSNLSESDAKRQKREERFKAEAAK